MKTTEMPVYIQKSCFTDSKAGMYTEGCGSTYWTEASFFHINVIKGQVSSPCSLLCSHFILRKHLFCDEHTHTTVLHEPYLVSQYPGKRQRDKPLAREDQNHNMDEGTLG